MKESARAARDEIAHNRNVAALKTLVGDDNEKVRGLENVRAQRMPPAVSAMVEREIMADILEGLAETHGSLKDPGDPLDESTVKLLADNGYDSLDVIREASDEDLLQVKGIGSAKLQEIREKVG